MLHDEPRHALAVKLAAQARRAFEQNHVVARVDAPHGDHETRETSADDRDPGHLERHGTAPMQEIELSRVDHNTGLLCCPSLALRAARRGR
jgi:hypothetical protein